MDQKRDDVIELCCEISAREQMEVAVRNSAQGAVVTGLGAFAGGMFMGPLGFPIGGLGGGLVAWLTSSDFRPLPEILMELPPEQQQELCYDVLAVLGNLVWTNKDHLIALVMGRKGLQQEVTVALHSFVTNKLGAEVRYQD